MSLGATLDGKQARVISHSQFFFSLSLFYGSSSPPPTIITTNLPPHPTPPPRKKNIYPTEHRVHESGRCLTRSIWATSAPRREKTEVQNSGIGQAAARASTSPTVPTTCPSFLLPPLRCRLSCRKLPRVRSHTRTQQACLTCSRFGTCRTDWIRQPSGTTEGATRRATRQRNVFRHRPP